MGWTTVYIRGKSGFEAEVLNNLQGSGLTFMPGYSNEKGLALYWIGEQEILRSFKMAISSKTIFKYRLRFFTNVEEFIESKHNREKELSNTQKRASVMRELNSWYEAQNN